MQLHLRSQIIKMTRSVYLSCALLCIVAFGVVLAEDGKEELKIEVLHKPDDCEVKSQKGALLSMHYKGTFEDGKQFDSR